MRTFAMSAVMLSLMLGVPAFAQTQTQASPGVSPQSPSGAATEQQSAQDQNQNRNGVTIRSIQVVDVEDLQSDTRAKVDELVANTKQEDLQSLRASIDATPQAVSALKAKGRVSTQVVAINIDDDGTLTMITKKST
ncbi:MAG: hypothetical protein WBA29_09155 [Xanthobacteraceae bacterium]